MTKQKQRRSVEGGVRIKEFMELERTGFAERTMSFNKRLRSAWTARMRVDKSRPKLHASMLCIRTSRVPPGLMGPGSMYSFGAKTVFGRLARGSGFTSLTTGGATGLFELISATAMGTGESGATDECGCERRVCVTV